jgi:outer membrane protein W
MKKLYLVFLLGIIAEHIIAQEYITEGQKRLNFAKIYLEIGGQYSPSFTGKGLFSNNLVQSFENSTSVTPYLNFGGLHFWGHADFYISVPLGQLNSKKSDSTNFQFNQSVVTGARFIPWAYRDNKIRPFVGASWAVVNFKQETKPNNNQPLLTKNKLLFDAGILYGKKSFIARAGVNIHRNNNLDYPVTQNNFQKIQTPNWNAYFGLVYAFESTRSKNMEAENTRMNKLPTVSSPTMNAIKEGDFFLAVGPSTSFMLSESAYNEQKFPFFNKKPTSNTHFDLALGYHFNKLGLVSALSYRNPKFTNGGFGSEQVLKKKSMVLETYKFLTDYSGFTPYIGLNYSYSRIDYSETNNTSVIAKTYNKFTPGLTFGWDILPGKTEQWIVLRTNLRWFPFESIDINGTKFSQNQIEYNVIQAVLYPSRFKNARSKINK